MSDVSDLVTAALRSRSEEAMMSVNTSRSAEDFEHRLDVEARRRTRRTVTVWAAAAAAVVLLGAGGLVVRQARLNATPTPVQSVATGSTFVSGTHHYTIEIEPGWTATAATAPWVYPATDPPTGSEDVIRLPKVNGTWDPGIKFGSMVIPSGMTDTQWLAWYAPASSSGTVTSACFPSYTRYAPITVDGHRGGLHGGLAGCNFTEAVVIVAHRAYYFAMFPDLQVATDQVVDRRAFERILSTVRFVPAGS